MAESALSMIVDREGTERMAAPRVSALWHDQNEMLGGVPMTAGGEQQAPTKLNPVSSLDNLMHDGSQPW